MCPKHNLKEIGVQFCTCVSIGLSWVSARDSDVGAPSQQCAKHETTGLVFGRHGTLLQTLSGKLRMPDGIAALPTNNTVGSARGLQKAAHPYCNQLSL